MLHPGTKALDDVIISDNFVVVTTEETSIRQNIFMNHKISLKLTLIDHIRCRSLEKKELVTEAPHVVLTSVPHYSLDPPRRCYASCSSWRREFTQQLSLTGQVLSVPRHSSSHFTAYTGCLSSSQPEPPPHLHVQLDVYRSSTRHLVMTAHSFPVSAAVAVVTNSWVDVMNTSSNSDLNVTLTFVVLIQSCHVHFCKN